MQRPTLRSLRPRRSRALCRARCESDAPSSRLVARRRCREVGGVVPARVTRVHLNADDVAPVDGERGDRGRGPYGASRGYGERGMSRALDVVQAAHGRVHVGAARCDASGF